MKKTYVTVLFTTLSFILIADIVRAQNISLFVTPSASEVTADRAFNISVSTNTGTAKAYAVEGKILFNNLSCRSIALAGNLIAQSMPTCSNPYFLVGIPSGASGLLAIFNISAAAQSAGSASVQFSGVDIIGEGVSLSSSWSGGNYTVKTAPIPGVPAKSTSTAPTSSTATTSQPSTEAATSTNFASTSQAAAGAATGLFGGNSTLMNIIMLIIGLVIGIAAVITFNSYRQRKDL